MSVFKIFGYWKYGKRCYKIITDMIPQKVEDGVLTTEEMSDIIREICDVFQIKAQIKVPEEMKKKYFDIVDYEKE